MNQGQSPAHAPAWVFFTYVSFAGALGMLVLGIALLPLDCKRPASALDSEAVVFNLG